jgi:hypothetical protein
MATPCSVNAQGSLRRPPRPPFDIAFCDVIGSREPGFDITICDIKAANSWCVR